MPVAITIIASLLLGLLLGKLFISPQWRTAVSGTIAHAGVWMAYTAVRFSPDIAVYFARTLVRTFNTSWPALMSVFGTMMADMTGQELSAAEVQELQTATATLDVGKVLARRLVPRFIGALFPSSPVSPAGARAAAEELLGQSVAFQLDNWADHTTLELLTLGQLQWMADFAESITAGLGLTRVTRRATQAMYRAAIGEQLEAHLNATYRPTRLRATELVDAWQQQLISDEDALRGLAEEGYSYERAILLLNLRQRDLGPTDVQYLLEIGQVDEAFVGRWARRQGYSEARAELAAARVTHYRTRNLLEEMADRARALYRDGKLTRASYEEMLRRARYRPAEIELVRGLDDMVAGADRLLTKAEALAGYREGALDERELREHLRALRYSDEAIDVLLVSERKKLTVAQLVDALIRGVLPETDVRRRLEEIGYQPTDVDVLLDLRVRRLSVGQVIDALTRQLIDPSAARRLLIQQGFSEEMIDLLMAFQRRTLGPGDIQAALVRGLISEGEAVSRFRALGYSDEDARLLLSLRFQLLSTGQILDTYESGMLTRRSALDRLRQLGWSPDDADLLLGTFEQKLFREGKPKPPAA